MEKIIRSVLLLLNLLLMLPAYAEQAASIQADEAIPFKEDRSIFVDAGLSIGSVIIFIIIVGLALWYLRKHNIGQFANMDKPKNIEIVEIRRLSTKSMAFLLKVNGADVFVVQNSDSVHSIQLNSNKE